ncbi:MAG: hypothetical protein LBN42_03450 [Oscillospiraceae bacterium]|nr:hypothetical protein [Oscillospiraceae bacterium]
MQSSKKRKIAVQISAIVLIVITVVSGVLSLYYLRNVDDVGRVVMYTGRVRGGGQLLVTRELNGDSYNNPDLIVSLGDVINELNDGGSRYSLVKIKDGSFRVDADELKKVYTTLCIVISELRLETGVGSVIVEDIPDADTLTMGTPKNKDKIAVEAEKQVHITELRTRLIKTGEAFYTAADMVASDAEIYYHKQAETAQALVTVMIVSFTAAILTAAVILIRVKILNVKIENYEKIIYTDEMTGLYNERAFMRDSEKLRKSVPMSPVGVIVFRLPVPQGMARSAFARKITALLTENKKVNVSAYRVKPSVELGLSDETSDSNVWFLLLYHTAEKDSVEEYITQFGTTVSARNLLQTSNDNRINAKIFFDSAVYVDSLRDNTVFELYAHGVQKLVDRMNTKNKGEKQ